MTAKELHEKILVLDSHCDTPIFLRRKGVDIGQRLQTGHVDLVRMKEGGVDASFFAIYVSNNWEPFECTFKALEAFASVYDMLDKNPDKVALATDAKTARALKQQGKIAIFLGMENAGPIHKDLSLLRLFHKMGVRYITLTHAGNNEVCDSSATKEKRWNGVSPFGRELIAEMNRLGVLVDVAHISDQAFYDVLNYSTRPVVSTHSCCRALCDVPRNLTDQMIIDLAAKGGVLQITFYPSFLDKEYATAAGPLLDAYEEAQELYDKDPVAHEERFKQAEKALYELPRPSYKRVVDHIDHVVQLVGPDHVGIGSDFDGIDVCPEGLEDVSYVPVITEELHNRGYSPQDIEKIMGGNFLRLLS
ncbi:MAG: dipeptidase [Bacteroidales bacterium]|jgi:membrane dipeptidase